MAKLSAWMQIHSSVFLVQEKFAMPALHRVKNGSCFLTSLDIGRCIALGYVKLCIKKQSAE